MIFQILNNRKKEILFFVLLLIIFYRSPHILMHGRFAAEEGAKYFANAYKYGFFYSLFFIEYSSGYMNLWANISASIANMFILELAPLISNYLALIPKLLIFYFILYKESYLIVDFKYKIFFCLLILLSPFNVPEIWLNSINSQIFFCILSFLLVLSKNDKSHINYLNLLIILISGFTGLYTCILLPIFFYKYLNFKTLQDKYNLSILSFCTLFQFFILVKSKTNKILYLGKLHAVDLDLFFNYLYNVPVKAFLGRSFTQFIDLGSYINIKFIFLLIFILILLIFFYLIYYFKKNSSLFSSKKFVINSLLYSFFSTSLFVMIGGTGQYVGGRYAALPSFYLITIALFLATIVKNYNLKIFFHLVLFMSFVSGAYEFKDNSKFKKYLVCMDCPNWIHEVEKFRKDNSYRLKIWPYPKKTLNLN
tara:strand:+ start:481 stop:1746 length:1266 start_codon:yes stop_codon:yes gene_type:complete